MTLAGLQQGGTEVLRSGNITAMPQRIGISRQNIEMGIGSKQIALGPQTFQVVRDAQDLDASNRWGSPYSGGSPTAMADGSVRTISYSIPSQTVIALCTPTGGEVIPNF